MNKDILILAESFIQYSILVVLIYTVVLQQHILNLTHAYRF